MGTLRRGYINSSGGIVVDPFIMFTGYLNTQWNVSEDWDGRWCKVETELVSPLAVLNQTRGIRADMISHQSYFAGDTFFKHIGDKPRGDFGWGVINSSFFTQP
jgi:hypothetical protein